MGLWQRILSRVTKPGTVTGSRRTFYLRGNISVNEDSANQVAAFNRGLIYISTQVAKLPWDVKDAKNNIISSPISDLLNLAPNDETNAFMFKLFLLQQAIIHGNSYAEIERNNLGAPIALWQLKTQSMSLTRDENNRLKYEYTNETGGTSILDPRDVFHVRNFHTKDGIIGQGIVSYGRDVLGIQIAADQMASGLFHNSGIPSGLLKHPGAMSDEAYARLESSWEEQAGGRKQGSTTILEEGVTYEAINMDPEVLQFLESRKYGILEIARFLGVPPTKFFDTTAATYSNVEQANLEVATDTLDSWATNLEMEADVKLLNYRYGGRYTDIDLYSIFRGDMKTRSDYSKTMVSIAAMTPNQVRDRERLPGYDGGDRYFVATNNYTPADRIDEVLDAEIKSKETPPAPPADKSKEDLANAAIEFLKK